MGNFQSVDLNDLERSARYCRNKQSHDYVRRRPDLNSLSVVYRTHDRAVQHSGSQDLLARVKTSDATKALPEINLFGAVSELLPPNQKSAGIDYDEKVDVEECLIEIPQMINKTQASTTTIISMSPFAWALDTINTDLIRLFMDSPLILMNSGIAYVSKHQHKSQETKLDFNQPTKSFSSFFFSQQQEFSTTPPIIQYGSTHASYELTPLEYIIAFKLCPHLLYHLQGVKVTKKSKVSQRKKVNNYGDNFKNNRAAFWEKLDNDDDSFFSHPLMIQLEEMVDIILEYPDTDVNRKSPVFRPRGVGIVRNRRVVDTMSSTADQANQAGGGESLIHLVVVSKYWSWYAGSGRLSASERQNTENEMYHAMFPSCGDHDTDDCNRWSYPTRYTTMQDMQASYDIAGNGASNTIGSNGTSPVISSTKNSSSIVTVSGSSSRRLWCRRHRAFLPPSNLYQVDPKNPKALPILASLQITKQRLLLDKLLSHPKVDITSKDEVEGMTLIHYAVVYRNVDALKLILSHPRFTKPSLLPSLYYSGPLPSAVIAAASAYSATPTTFTASQNPVQQTGSGRLTTRSTWDNSNSGKHLLKRILEERDYEGRTALYLATIGGSIEIARILIEAGADYYADRKPLISDELNNHDADDDLIHVGLDFSDMNQHRKPKRAGTGFLRGDIDKQFRDRPIDVIFRMGESNWENKEQADAYKELMLVIDTFEKEKVMRSVYH